MKKINNNGMALSMSGGGHRATLFHLGSLIRLNELGYLNKWRACKNPMKIYIGGMSGVRINDACFARMTRTMFNLFFLPKGNYRKN